MLFAFDSYLRLNNTVIPIGYNEIEFDHFPSEEELYNKIIHNYGWLHDNSAELTTFMVKNIPAFKAIKLKGRENEYYVTCNNVREITLNKKTKNKNGR